MTLGQSQHFYTHMSVVLSCALIGLGLSAGLPLPYLFCVSTFSLFSLLRGWRSPPLTAGPGAVDLVLIILLYFLFATLTAAKAKQKMTISNISHMHDIQFTQYSPHR